MILHQFVFFSPENRRQNRTAECQVSESTNHRAAGVSVLVSPPAGEDVNCSSFDLILKGNSGDFLYFSSCLDPNQQIDRHKII